LPPDEQFGGRIVLDKAPAQELALEGLRKAMNEPTKKKSSEVREDIEWNVRKDEVGIAVQWELSKVRLRAVSSSSCQDGSMTYVTCGM